MKLDIVEKRVDDATTQIAGVSCCYLGDDPAAASIGSHFANNYSGPAEQTTLNFRDDDPEMPSESLVGKG